MAHSLAVVRTYISKVFGKNTTPILKQTQLIYVNTCVSFFVQVSNILEHDVIDDISTSHKKDNNPSFQPFQVSNQNIKRRNNAQQTKSLK